MNYLHWWIVAAILLVSWFPRGHDLHEKRARMTILAVLTGLLLASFMPNKWLAVYTVVFVAGLFRVPSPADRLPLTVWPALIFAFLYVLLAPASSPAWLPPLLWSIACSGLVLSAWWGVSMYLSQGHYDKILTWRGRTLLHLYEHQPHWNTQPFFCCGQGNVNFAQALAGAAVAASVGLIVIGEPWGWLLLAVTVPPAIKIKGHWWHWPHVSQGWAYLLVIGMAYASVKLGLWALLASGTILVCLAVWSWVRFPEHWSGRQEIWAWGFEVWSSMSWQGKLIGGGPESWIHIFQRDIELQATRMEKQRMFATHAHNEFLQELVERGILGCGAMVGYLATTMYSLWHLGTPDAYALLISGACFLTCMSISFPSTIYHEMAFADRGDVTGHGMPGMNVIGLALAILAAGVIR